VLSQTERIASIPGEFVLRHNLSKSAISEVFLCTFNNLDAVIRLDSKCATKLSIDRENEFMLLKNIQYLDIAPKALYVDPTNGISIWEYVQGKEVTFHPADTKQSIRSLGKSLRAIHSIAIPEHSVDIFSNSMSLYHDLLENTSDAHLFKKASNLYNELLKDDVSKVLSHNDLHPRNLLWANKYYFLDWEYAGPNDRYFDIASVIKTFQLNKSQILELLSGYSSNAKIFDIDKINKWIVFIYNLDKLWKISVERVNQT
jgi:thiamine kinase-like enzyme